MYKTVTVSPGPNKMGELAALRVFVEVSNLLAIYDKVAWLFAIAPSQQEMWEAFAPYASLLPVERLIRIHMDNEEGQQPGDPQQFSVQFNQLQARWGWTTGESFAINIHQDPQAVLDEYNGVLERVWTASNGRFGTIGWGEKGAHCGFDEWDEDNPIDLNAKPWFYRAPLKPWCVAQQRRERGVEVRSAFTVRTGMVAQADSLVACAKGRFKASAAVRVFSGDNPHYPFSRLVGTANPVHIFMDEAAAAGARKAGLLTTFGYPPKWNRKAV